MATHAVHLQAHARLERWPRLRGEPGDPLPRRRLAHVADMSAPTCARAREGVRELLLRERRAVQRARFVTEQRTQLQIDRHTARCLDVEECHASSILLAQ